RATLQFSRADLRRRDPSIGRQSYEPTSFLILARDELGLDRKLLGREPYRFPRRLLVDAFHLKQHSAGLDDRHPSFGRAFAFSHAGLRRFLGDWLIREDANPDLSASLYKPGHSHARSLDLLAGDPRRFQRLQPVLAKRYLRAPRGDSAHAAALLPAVFHSFWNLIFSHRSCLAASLFPARTPPHGHLIAAVDPDFHPNNTKSRICFGEPVVDVRPQRVQREPALEIPLRTRYLSPVQPAGHSHL